MPQYCLLQSSGPAMYGMVYYDTLEMVEASLEYFDETWDSEYPHVIKYWCNNWEGLMVFFNYFKDIRKAVDTTNTT